MPKRVLRKPGHKPASWEPKLRALTPMKRETILQLINGDPSILHYDKNPRGYKALAEKLRRSKFFGRKNMIELLTHDIGLVPYAMGPNGFNPTHPTPEWFARKVQLAIERGASHVQVDWRKNPKLAYLLNYSAKNQHFGYSNWTKLLEAIKAGTFKPTIIRRTGTQ